MAFARAGQVDPLSVKVLASQSAARKQADLRGRAILTALKAQADIPNEVDERMPGQPATEPGCGRG